MYIIQRANFAGSFSGGILVSCLFTFSVSLLTLLGILKAKIKGANKIRDFQEDGKIMPEEAKELINDPSLLAGKSATGDIEGLVRQTRADAEIKLRSV